MSNPHGPVSPEWEDNPLGELLTTFVEPKLEPLVGVYRMGDLVYKIVQTHGEPYARVLVINERKDGTKWGRWDYVPGIVNQLMPSMLVTPETAAGFGTEHGVCCMCGSELELQESKDRGYGPTCASNNDWPYDYSRKE